MNFADWFRAFLSTVSGHPVLERLFFASIEFAALVLLVWFFVRMARIKSARLMSLLWLVALAKPIVSLALGSPLPVLKVEIDKTAPGPADQFAANQSPLGARQIEDVPVAGAVSSGAAASGREFPNADFSFARTPDEGLFPRSAPPVEFADLPSAAPNDANAAETATATTPPAVPARWNAATMAISLWLAGVVFFVFRSALDRLRLRRLIRRAVPPDAALSARYGQLATAFRVKRAPRLKVTDELESPALVGSLVPTVLIPRWLVSEQDRDKIDWALRHELMHWKLFDTHAGLVREVAQALFYFHPAVWWAGRQWEVAAELACDRAIIADEAESRDYAAQLYGMLVGIRDRRRFPVKSGLFATRTQIKQRIAALVQGPCRTRAHLGAFALVAVAAVSLAALSIGGTFADKEPLAETSVASDESSAAETPLLDPGVNAEPDKPKNDASVMVHGRVLDAQGKPVANAKLYAPRAVRDRQKAVHEQMELHLVGTAGDDGRFAVRLPDKGSAPSYLDESSLVAYCEGLAVNWIDIADSNRDKPQEIVLQPEQIIRGRLIDTEGRPVVKANIVVDGLMAPITGRSLDPYLLARRNQPHDAWSKNLKSPPVGLESLFKTESDADGRFKLPGGSAETIYSIVITADSIVWTSLWAVNRSGFTPEPGLDANSKQTPWAMPVLAAPDFTHVCEPGFKIEGRVTTAGDQPVERVVIKAFTLGLIGSFTTGYATAITDPDGRYRLSGLRRGARIEVGFGPDQASGLLSRSETVNTPAAEERMALDVELKRGILVTGQVRDETTGSGVYGIVSTQALVNNEHMKTGALEGHSGVGGETDANGKFSVTVVPGPAVVKVQPTGGKIRIGDQYLSPFCQPFVSEDERRRTGLGKYDLELFAAASVVNFAPEDGPQSLNLDLKRGKSLDVLFVDDKGLPVENVFISGITELWTITAQLTEPHCTVYALSADRPRKVLVLQAQKRLAGSITLTGDEQPPVKVALVPSASIRGRAATREGLAIGNAVVKLRFDHETTNELYRFHPLHSSEISTDHDGRFEARDIVPDEPFLFEMELEQEYLVGQPAKKRTKLTSGQQLDVGEIVFAPPQPDVSTNKTKEAKSEPDAMPGGAKSAATPSPGTLIAQRTTAGDRSKAVQSNAGEVEFGGKVVDADGQPVAGAEIWLAARVIEPDDPAAQGIVRQLARSDEQGKFSFRVAPVGAGATDAANWTHGLQVTAKAAGYGCDWLPLAAFETNPVSPEARDAYQQLLEKHKRLGAGRFASRTLKLPPEAGPVRGHLVDLEGRPLSNVTLSIERIVNLDSALLSQAFKQTSKDVFDKALHALTSPSSISRSEWQALVPPVKTNENGEFSLPGLGRDQLAEVTFSGERVAAEHLFILGRETDTKHLPHNSGNAVYVGTRFTHAVGPGVPVNGVVTEFKSGKPITGATVVAQRLFGGDRSSSRSLWNQTDHIRAVTDDQGRYRLVGIPPGKGHVLNVIPPMSEPWLIASHEFSLDPDQKNATVNMQVFRGIWIEGRVTDSPTGENVAGDVDYLALQKNPNIPQRFGLQDGFKMGRFSIDESGHYRVAGLPGPGVLLVRAFRAKTVYPLGAGAEKVDGYDPNRVFLPTSPVAFRFEEWHRIVQIDPPLDAQSHTVDLTLSAGASLVGRVVGPRGVAVANVEAAGVVEKDERFNDLKLNDGKFTIYNYDPAVPRNLFFRANGNSLVGYLHLEGAPPAELTVTLQPAVTVRGRLIETETDVEAVGYHLYCDSTRQGKFRLDDVTTDEKGRFELKGILAGNVYTMDAGNPQYFYSGKNGFTIDLTNAKPGDVVELGDVTGKKAKSTVQREPAKPPEKPAGDPQVGPAVNGGKKEAPPVTGSGKSKSITIGGIVLKPDGTPAAGATVRAAVALWAMLEPIVGNDFKSPMSETKADAQGRFSISFPTQPFGDLSQFDQRWGEVWKRTKIAASLSGFGPAWIEYGEIDLQKPVTLKLVEDVRIRGRVVDLEGRPVAGTTVKVSGPQTSKDEDLSEWIEGIKAGELPWTVYHKASRSVEPRLVGTPTLVTTDREGMFEIHGVGRERIVNLTFEGDTVAHRAASAVTRKMQPIRRTVSPPPFEGTESVFGAEFTFIAEPARTIEGVVRDAKSGEHLAGVSVESYKLVGYPYSNHRVLKTKTDDLGRFRLIGMPKGSGNKLLLVPHDEQPYFMRQADVPDPVGLGPAKMEIELHRGIWIAGRVTDKATAKPVPGVRLHYLPFRSNEYAQRTPEFDSNGNVDGDQMRYVTNPDGTYRLVGLPGRAIVGAESVLQNYRRGVGYDAINAPKDQNTDHLDTYRNPINPGPKWPSVMREINPAADAESVSLDLQLDPGQSLRIRVVDPSGEQVSGVSVTGLSSDGYLKASQEPVLIAANFGPGETRIVLFHHEGRKLGRVVTIGPEQLKAGEMTVELQPCATVVGRILNADGLPVTGMALRLDVRPGGDFFRHLPQVSTDAEGRFRVTLLPGCQYSFNGEGGGFQFVNFVKELSIEPGETKDLGTLTIGKDGKVMRQAASGPVKATVPSTEYSVLSTQSPGQNNSASGKSQSITISGTILTPDGKPFTGARLRLEYARANDSTWKPSPPFSTTSGADGKFKFSIPESEFDLSAGDEPRNSARIVGVADGFGFDEVAVKPDQQNDLRLQLVKDVPINGRILTLEGTPVAGAVIRLRGVQWTPGDNLDAYMHSLGEGRLNFRFEKFSGGPLTAGDTIRTDAEGKFQLKGMGAERLVALYVEGPTIEHWWIHVLTRETKPVVQPLDMPTGRMRPDRAYGASFEHLAAPSRLISGTVRDQANGKPLAGVTVRGFVGSTSNTKTNEAGRFELFGYPKSREYQLNALPGDGQPYFAAIIKIADTPGLEPIAADIALSTGTVCRGQLTDKSTGQPVAGEVQYYPLSPNAAAGKLPRRDAVGKGWSAAAIKRDGQFVVPVLPGPGVLAFRARGSKLTEYASAFISPADVEALLGSKLVGRQMARDEWDESLSVSMGGPAISAINQSSYHALALINPVDGEDSIAKDVALTPGQTLRGTLLGPDDQPLIGVTVIGLTGQSFASQSLETADFEALGLSGQRPRTLLFTHNEKKLGLALAVRGDEPQPLVVQLKPLGAAIGRLLDKEGEPVRETTLNFFRERSFGPGGSSTRTDRDGRFRVEGLVPGQKYMLTHAEKVGGMMRIAVFSIEPGETKDLGELQLKLGGGLPAAKPVSDAVQESPKPPFDPPVKNATNGGKDGSVVIHGRVLGPDGKPAAKAHAAVVGSRIRPERGGDLSSRSDVLAEGVTDDAGRFEIKLSGVSAKTHSLAHIIARADDSGLAWRRIDPDERDVDVSLELPAEQMIRGRFIDIEGQPAGAVQMSVNSVAPRAAPGTRVEQVGHYQFAKPPRAWPPSVTASQDGSFAIRGIPADHGIHLAVEGNDRFAPQSVTLNTGAPEQRPESDATYRSLVRNVKPGAEAVLPLAPAQIFEGVVRFGDTGEPAPHARLTVFSSQQEQIGSWYGLAGKADAQGRYNINPHPGVRFWITAYPPDGAPYMTRKIRDLTHKDGTLVKQVDVSLPRGVLIRGRITESKTNNPIADATIQYIPEKFNNPNSNEDIITGADGIQLSGQTGEFETTVLPGPGTLLVHGPRGEYVLQETSSRQLERGVPGGERNYANAIVRVNPPAGSAPLDLTIELQRGATISGRITTVAGESVEHALVVSRLFVHPTSLNWRGFPREALGGRFDLLGLAQGVECPVHFLDAKKRLGATAMFKADDKSPTVVLLPCGEASATITDDSGKALVGYFPRLDMVVTPGPDRFEAAADAPGVLAGDAAYVVNIDRTNYQKAATSDDQGRITYPALIPGGRYRIITYEKGVAINLKEFVAESGKTLELGKIVYAAKKEE